jgi:hypothetical protein
LKSALRKKFASFASGTRSVIRTLVWGVSEWLPRLPPKPVGSRMAGNSIQAGWVILLPAILVPQTTKHNDAIWGCGPTG